VIRSDQGNEFMNTRKSTKVYTAFLFMGCPLWKENIEDRVKWGNDVSKNLAPTRVGPCSSLHYPHPYFLLPPPLPRQKSAPLGHNFCLTGHEWSLKFREKTAKSSNYVTYSSNFTLTRLEGATIITLFVIGCPERKKSITLNIK